MFYSWSSWVSASIFMSYQKTLGFKISALTMYTLRNLFDVDTQYQRSHITSQWNINLRNLSVLLCKTSWKSHRRQSDSEKFIGKNKKYSFIFSAFMVILHVVAFFRSCLESLLLYYVIAYLDYDFFRYIW